MVNCSCGKKMEKVPNWLQSVNVQFICNNCPNRQIKSISQLSVEEAAKARAAEAAAASKAAEDALEAEDDLD